MHKQEAALGISWGSLTPECLTRDWSQLPLANTWWFYEMANASPEATLDWQRIMGNTFLDDWLTISQISNAANMQSELPLD